MQRGRVAQLAVLLALILGLVAVGCGGDDDESSAAGGTTAAAGESTATGEKIGGSVEILGAFSGDRGDGRSTTPSRTSRTRTGIDVKYTSTNDLTTLIRTRVNGGNPPNIALFPQPGLLLDLAKQGHVVPLDEHGRPRRAEEDAHPGLPRVVDGGRQDLRACRCGWPSRACSGTRSRSSRTRATRCRPRTRSSSRSRTR